MTEFERPLLPTAGNVTASRPLDIDTVEPVEVKDFGALIIVDNNGNDLFGKVSRPIDLQAKRP